MGPISARVAAESGDQLIHVVTEPQQAMAAMAAFRAAGGMGKPCMAEISFCYHEDEATAKEIAYKWWPIVAFRASSTGCCRAGATTSSSSRW